MSKPKDWKVDDLVQLCVYMCHPDVVEAISDDVAGFIAELDSVVQAVDRRVYRVNEAANSGIMARLIQFRHCNPSILNFLFNEWVVSLSISSLCL